MWFENVVPKLENDALAISEWFPNNHFKLNEDKCHLMIFCGKSDEASVKIGEDNVKESKEEKLLGIIFDQTLSFKHGGGGGLSAKFRVGMCRLQFQNGTLARPILVKMIPLARITSLLEDFLLEELKGRFVDKSCQIFAFSGQNFFLIWFFYRNYRTFTVLRPKLPKSIPLPRLNSTKIAKKYTLG